MSREEKSNLMLSLVDGWQKSGQSQVEFASNNNIKLFTLRYWINKSRKCCGGLYSKLLSFDPQAAVV